MANHRPNYFTRSIPLLDAGFDTTTRPLTGQLDARALAPARNEDEQFLLDRWDDRKVPKLLHRY